MTSVEFRKHYARLTEPVVVTALGRAIGTWYPAGSEPEMRIWPDPSVTATASRAPDPYYPTTTAGPPVSTRPIVPPGPKAPINAYRRVAAKPKA